MPRSLGQPGAADLQLTLIEMHPEASTPAPRRKKDLDLRELSAWARRQSRAIATARKTEPGSPTLLLAQTVKLGEEVGELYAEVLGFAQMQRTSKLDQFSAETLRDEVADVLICTAILADLVGIDLAQAVRAKMQTIDERNDHQGPRHSIAIVT